MVQVDKEKGFFGKWKDGILNLSVEQQLKAKLFGIQGGIVGLVLALISMLYSKMWGFAIFIFFVIFLQVISYISMRQQYIATKKMLSGEDMVEENLYSHKIDEEFGNFK